MAAEKETGLVESARAGADAEAGDSPCKRRKRQKILEAAARAFAGHHLHEVCTEHIASAAGVGKGTLFRYFASKEELFVATLVYSVEVAAAELDRALAGLAEPREKLETACENLVSFYRENGHLFHLLHHHRAVHDQPGHQEFHAKQDLLRGKIAEIIAAGRRAGRFRDVDPVLAGRLLFAMLRTALRSPEMKDRSPDEIARTLLDVFLRGVGRPRSEEAPAAQAGPGRTEAGE